MQKACAAGLIALALMAPGPVLAQQISAEADKLMWCASAFYWLAGSAGDAGEAIEAELYDGWATELTQDGTTLLTAAGFDVARIQELIGRYDSLVLDELASEKPRYDVAKCQELVTE
jgi:hypothetical protein